MWPSQQGGQIHSGYYYVQVGWLSHQVGRHFSLPVGVDTTWVVWHPIIVGHVSWALRGYSPWELIIARRYCANTSYFISLQFQHIAMVLGRIHSGPWKFIFMTSSTTAAAEVNVSLRYFLYNVNFPTLYQSPNIRLRWLRLMVILFPVSSASLLLVWWLTQKAAGLQLQRMQLCSAKLIFFLKITNFVARGGFLLTELFPVVTKNSTTFWLSRLATATSPVQKQLYSCTSLVSARLSPCQLAARMTSTTEPRACSWLATSFVARTSHLSRPNSIIRSNCRK